MLVASQRNTPTRAAISQHKGVIAGLEGQPMVGGVDGEEGRSGVREVGVFLGGVSVVLG